MKMYALFIEDGDMNLDVDVEFDEDEAFNILVDDQDMFEPPLMGGFAPDAAINLPPDYDNLNNPIAYLRNDSVERLDVLRWWTRAILRRNMAANNAYEDFDNYADSDSDIEDYDYGEDAVQDAVDIDNAPVTDANTADADNGGNAGANNSEPQDAGDPNNNGESSTESDNDDMNGNNNNNNNNNNNINNSNNNNNSNSNNNGNSNNNNNNNNNNNSNNDQHDEDINTDDDDDDDNDEDDDEYDDSDADTINNYDDVDEGNNDGGDDDDAIIKQILAAQNVKRSHPSDIIIDDFVCDLSFHPVNDILAVGTMSGDILIYKYSNEENVLLHTHEMHTKAVRNIEFSDCGSTLFSVSKDKSIIASDIETGKFKVVIDDAHPVAINRLYNIDEHLLATGDDNGTVVLWDLRASDREIFKKKAGDDFISSILSIQSRKYLMTSSGDGYVTSFDIRSRKMLVQSECHEETLTSMGLFRNDSKAIVSSTKGSLYTYNWGEFGFYTEKYTAMKSPINVMIPITQRIAIVGGEDGILRALHVVPGRNLGIVGQHNLCVEAMDISNDGELIASSSHDGDIKFWNVKYFEDFDNIQYNKKVNKPKKHLPSSKYSENFFAGLA